MTYIPPGSIKVIPTIQAATYQRGDCVGGLLTLPGLLSTSSNEVILRRAALVNAVGSDHPVGIAIPRFASDDAHLRKTRCNEVFRDRTRWNEVRAAKPPDICQRSDFSGDSAFRWGISSQKKASHRNHLRPTKFILGKPQTGDSARIRSQKKASHRNHLRGNHRKVF